MIRPRSPLTPATRGIARLRRAYRDVLLALMADDLFADQPEDIVDLVTAVLSDLASAAMEAGLSIARAELDPDADVRMAVIALGKTGARELNYVSDVDVVFVLASESTDAQRRLATEVARRMRSILSDPGAEPALWEVDTALRPEGKAGALVRTMSEFEHYYADVAKNWEFQALLKARPVAGDSEVGTAFTDTLGPLVWGGRRPGGLHRRDPGDAPSSRRPHPRRRSAAADQTRTRGTARRRVLRAAPPARPRAERRRDPVPEHARFVPVAPRRARLHRPRRCRSVLRGLPFHACRRTPCADPADAAQRPHPRRRGEAADSRTLRLHLRHPLGERLEETRRDFAKQVTRAARADLLPSRPRRRRRRPRCRRRRPSPGHEPPGGRRPAPRLRLPRPAGCARPHQVAHGGHVAHRPRHPAGPAGALDWFSDGVDPDAALLSFRRLTDSLSSSGWFLKMSARLRARREVRRRGPHALRVRDGTPLCRQPAAVAWLDDYQSLHARDLEVLGAEIEGLLSRHGGSAVSRIRETYSRERCRASPCATSSTSATGPRCPAISPTSWTSRSPVRWRPCVSTSTKSRRRTTSSRSSPWGGGAAGRSGTSPTGMRCSSTVPATRTSTPRRGRS